MILEFVRNRLIKLLRPALIGLPASALILVSLAADCHALSQTKKDIQELQRNVFVLQSDISDLKTKIDKLPSDEAMTQIRQSQADLLTQVQDLLRQVQVLTGRFEESRYFTDKLLNDTAADMEVLKTRVDDATGGMTKKQAEDLISRVEGIEETMASLDERLAAIEQATGQLPAEATEKEPEPKEESPEDVYEAALDTYTNNDFKDARRMMEAFIEEYPDHKLAGNAQFWIADAYYSEKEYADAILAYEDLLQKYKGHAKIPAALLKQALAFLEMGDEKAAIGILRELIENHPDSEQAKTAKEKLSTLESEKSTESSETAGPPEKAAEKK
jgi:tol-pal system protein YbgF